MTLINYSYAQIADGKEWVKGVNGNEMEI